MSDADVRELERRFRETGGMEDEAAWLRELVRLGSLSHDRLNLAAWLGHGPACVASPQQAQLEFTEDHLVLARRLQDWGIQTTFRAAVAVLRQLDPSGKDLAAIEELERWLCGFEVKTSLNWSEGDGLSFHSGMPGFWLREIWTFDQTFADLQGELDGVKAWALHVGSALRYGGVELNTVAGPLRDELVPWALGHSDPVRERVEASQRKEAGGDSLR